MKGTFLGAVPFVACALASMAGAQITKAALTIGGPGSCSSEGFDDPGLLGDGVTAASATLEYTLDAGNGVLEIKVTNTSPVVAGVNNPLLTELYFNAPVQVTGMNLTGQTAELGATPAYAFSFDGNLMSNPQPNKAGKFGAYSGWLSDTGDIAGTIANGNADTWVKPLAELAHGAVRFTFSLAGDLTGVEAKHFATVFSVIPPGDKPSHATAHFQAGGVSSSSAFINDSPEQCFLVVADARGSDAWGGPIPTNYPFATQLGSVRNAFGTTIESPLMIELPRKGKRNKLASLSRTVLDRFTVQVVMWNPDVFPTNPEQSSAGLEVVLYEDGTFAVVPFGVEAGMSLSHELVRLPDGRSFLTFPFAIEGF